MELSIIIPTFNRANVVVGAIESALCFLKKALSEGEIVVVDDASTDGSEALIRSKYGAEMDAGLVRLIGSHVNVGATGAKQLGAQAAAGRWLLFLDSDDRLVQESTGAVLRVLRNSSERPIVFFRCVEMRSGRLIGSSGGADSTLSLEEFVREGTPGECLPVLARTAILNIPFDQELRGFEALTYARIVRKFGPALVSQVIAREYCTEGDPQRLSLRRNTVGRSCAMARGYARMIAEFRGELGVGLVPVLLRLAYYGAICNGQRWVKHLLEKRVERGASER